MDVRVVDHPLAAARLTTLRDERTDNAAFRAALRDLTLMLVYEATRDAAVETVSVRTPLAETTGSRLANPPLLVPVLRAGLGMVDQAHALIPEARVGFVGVARDEETHEPTPYLESLPDDLSTQPVIVLDPMLATGGSMAHTIALLQSRNAVDITAICVVVAPEGIAALEKVAPNCGCSPRPSTSGSTTSPTSCRVSATPATGSSGRARRYTGSEDCTEGCGRAQRTAPSAILNKPARHTTKADARRRPARPEPPAPWLGWLRDRRRSRSEPRCRT